MPSHRMNNGTQASEGTLRNPCTRGSSSSRQVREYPVSEPATVAAAAPRKKPANTRYSVMPIWPNSSLVAAMPAISSKTAVGAGSLLGGMNPTRQAASHKTRRMSGMTRPRPIRRRRAAPPPRARRGAALSVRESLAGGARSATAMTALSGRLVRGQLLGDPLDVLRIDQGVDGRGHIDIGRNDACLLQRHSCRQDRVMLRGPDDRMRQVGALAQLLRRHLVVELGGLDENGAQLVRMVQRPFARMLIGHQHALDQLRVLLRELLAHIEDAPAVLVGVTVEEHGAVLQLRLRHIGVEAGPGVDLAVDERVLAVGMLQQDDADILVREADAGERAQQEDVGIGP